ncbi:MAG TPA: hypothetical protein PLG79_03950 [Spirochaetales bacterium]|nr:hypothetical protein [Spirochaetales bacterium]HOV37853.1 hypothetical protein [Spirochaetales bacterium]
MKKGILWVLFLFLVLGTSVYTLESEYYARTIYIEKVFPHQLGYKILYTTSKLDIAEAYIPHKWFSQSSSRDGELVKGEVQWGDDPSYPYMIIFWKNGKFSHVRLFLKKNMHDLSWGSLNPTQDLTEKFNVEEIVLEF